MHEAATAAGLADGYAVSVIGGSPMIEEMGSRLESEYTDRAGIRRIPDSAGLSE